MHFELHTGRALPSAAHTALKGKRHLEIRIEHMMTKVTEKALHCASASQGGGEKCPCTTLKERDHVRMTFPESAQAGE